MATIKYLREYYIIYYPEDADPYASVLVDSPYETQKYFSKIPTKEEVNELLETQDLEVNINGVFYGCTNLLAAPKLPERAWLNSTGNSYGTFSNCNNLKIAPKLPTEFLGTVRSLRYAFSNCIALSQAPVIPQQVKRADYMFYGASGPFAPVSIPDLVTNTTYMYRDASNTSGEMIIRSSPTSYSWMFRGTTKPITLYGDKAKCETLAATANNGNVSWSAWYDPIPAVTDRGQGSYTTAEDITRMVRNGALAVSSYAPGRMVYHQGDIVRADEWAALVEAAQTIDPTITLSTNYDNLNRIEAAFDSAL